MHQSFRKNSIFCNIEKIIYKKKIYWNKKKVKKLVLNIKKKQDSIMWKKICC